MRASEAMSAERRESSLVLATKCSKVGPGSPTVAPAEIVLSLLIDQSGSMKGAPIAAAAATAAWLPILPPGFGARIRFSAFRRPGGTVAMRTPTGSAPAARNVLAGSAP